MRNLYLSKVFEVRDIEINESKTVKLAISWEFEKPDRSIGEQIGNWEIIEYTCSSPLTKDETVELDSALEEIESPLEESLDYEPDPDLGNDMEDR